MLEVILPVNGGVSCEGELCVRILSRVSLVVENEVLIELPGRVFVLTDPKGSSVAFMTCELVVKTKTLDVCCCLVSLVEESSAAKLKFLSVE